MKMDSVLVVYISFSGGNILFTQRLYCAAAASLKMCYEGDFVFQELFDHVCAMDQFIL